MRIVGVVQARLGSTRFPRKVLADLAGVPMLVFLLRRLARSYYLDELVVATPLSDRDEIADEVQAMRFLGIRANPQDSDFNGRHIGFRAYDVPEDDLVGRHAAVAREFDADLIVRVPGDNPFVDPHFVDMAVARADWNRYRPAELPTTLALYVTGGILDGLGAEVYTREQIEALDHVEDVREHPHEGLDARRADFRDWRHGEMRFDVNTPGDLARLNRIAAAMPGPFFTARHLNAAPHELLAYRPLELSS